jgi:hypothetical protein
MFNACTWMVTVLNSGDSWGSFTAGGAQWWKQNYFKTVSVIFSHFEMAPCDQSCHIKYLKCRNL